MTETLKLAIVISGAFRGADAFDKAGGGIAGITAALKKMSVQIQMMAAMMAFDFLKKGFDNFVQFEQRMAEAGSIVGATKEEIADFSDQIREMAKTLPQTADELGAGLYDVFSAGVTDSAKAMDTLELAAKAAVAGLTDTATSVKAGISTMNAFGMGMEDLNHIYDVQFLTIKRGILRYGELADVIGNVAPSAQAAGQEMEDMYATLAFLTTKGLNAANAATALGRAYDALTMPATITKLREMGVSVADMTDEIMASDPLLKGMRQSIQDASSALAAAVINTQNATTTYNYQKSELEKLESQYDETKAALQEFGDEMADISLEQRKNRLEIMKIQQSAENEGRELTDSELARIETLQNANNNLSIQYEELGIKQTELNKVAKEQEDTVASASEALKIAESDMNAMTEAQTLATTTLDEANTEYDELVAQTGNFRPLIDIVKDLNTQLDGLSEVAKAQIIAEIFPQIRARKAIVSIMNDTETLTGFIDEMTDSTQSAGAMQDAFATNLDTTSNDLKLMTNSITDLQMSISQDLLPVVQTFMGVLGPLVNWLSENTEVIWMLVAAFIAYKVIMLAASIANVVFGTTLMATPIGWIVMAIAGLILLIMALILWWDEIVVALEKVGEAILGGLKAAFDAIIGAVDWLINALTNLWNMLGDVATGIADFFLGLIDGALQWGKDLIDMFIQGVKDGIAGMGDVLGDAVDTVAGWIGFDVKANDDMAKRWGSDLLTYFSEGIGEAIPEVSLASDNVVATLSDNMVNGDAVSSVTSGMGTGMGTGTSVETNDVYEINVNVEKLDSNTDIQQMVGKIANEISMQKKKVGTANPGGS